MFQLKARKNENTKEITSEVFVIGEIHQATAVAKKLLANTNCEIVEVFRKAKGEVVAVLTKPVMI